MDDRMRGRGCSCCDDDDDAKGIVVEQCSTVRHRGDQRWQGARGPTVLAYLWRAGRSNSNSGAPTFGPASCLLLTLPPLLSRISELSLHTVPLYKKGGGGRRSLIARVIIDVSFLLQSSSKARPSKTSLKIVVSYKRFLDSLCPVLI